VDANSFINYSAKGQDPNLADDITLSNATIPLDTATRLLISQ
jgi:hypothetical protein